MLKAIRNHSPRSVLVSISLIFSLSFYVSCSKKEAKTETKSAQRVEIKSQKLTSNASSSSGKTLFVSLSPEESGIKSEIIQKADHPYAYFYNSGLEASGVAVGDIDRDGLPDLFLASSPGGNRLYRQISPLKFEDITQGSGLEKDNAWGRGASLVDIDNDGDLDIYVANYGQNNSLYINQGVDQNGKIKFTENAKAAGIDTIDASLMPSFCDYDGDGDLDLLSSYQRISTPSKSHSTRSQKNDREG